MAEVSVLDQAISGTTVNGVPFFALPPEDGLNARALIILWHGADPPRTEAALAGALPLRDLPAWRVYLGLPLSGRRMPEGGPDELMVRGAEDAIALLFHPIIAGAVDELPAAVDDLRESLAIDSELPLGIFGFSAGGSAALLAVARRLLPIHAAVTFGAVTDLRAMVEHLSSLFGTSYEWTTERKRLEQEISVVHRGRELAESGAEILLATGSDDSDAIVDPTKDLEAAIRRERGSAEFCTINGIGHEFVDEPGVDATPQGPRARALEQVIVEWFGARLINDT